MPHFRRHIPGFVEYHSHRLEFDYADTADLLQQIRAKLPPPGRPRTLAIHDNTLIAVYDDGFDWWVLGFVSHPEDLDIPRWDGGKYRVTFDYGDTVVVVPESQVASICGDDVTLRDGRVGRLMLG